MLKLAKYEMTASAILGIKPVVENSGIAFEVRSDTVSRMAARAIAWIQLRRSELGLESTGYHTSYHRTNLFKIAGINSITDNRLPIFIRTKQCSCCGKRIGLQVDHIVPLSFGGNNSNMNGQVLCPECHYLKDTSIVQFHNRFDDFSKVPKVLILSPHSALFSKSDCDRIRNSLNMNIRSVDDMILLVQSPMGEMCKIDYPRKEQLTSDAAEETSVNWLNLFDKYVEFIPTETDRYDLFLILLFSKKDSYKLDEIRQIAFDEKVCRSASQFRLLYTRLSKLYQNNNRIWGRTQ